MGDKRSVDFFSQRVGTTFTIIGVLVAIVIATLGYLNYQLNKERQATVDGGISPIPAMEDTTRTEPGGGTNQDSTLSPQLPPISRTVDPSTGSTNTTLTTNEEEPDLVYHTVLLQLNRNMRQSRNIEILSDGKNIIEHRNLDIIKLRVPLTGESQIIEIKQDGNLKCKESMIISEEDEYIDPCT